MAGRWRGEGEAGTIRGHRNADGQHSMTFDDDITMRTSSMSKHSVRSPTLSRTVQAQSFYTGPASDVDMFDNFISYSSSPDDSGVLPSKAEDIWGNHSQEIDENLMNQLQKSVERVKDVLGKKLDTSPSREEEQEEGSRRSRRSQENPAAAEVDFISEAAEGSSSGPGNGGGAVDEEGEEDEEEEEEEEDEEGDEEGIQRGLNRAGDVGREEGVFREDPGVVEVTSLAEAARKMIAKDLEGAWRGCELWAEGSYDDWEHALNEYGARMSVWGTKVKRGGGIGGEGRREGGRRRRRLTKSEVMKLDEWWYTRGFFAGIIPMSFAKSAPSKIIQQSTFFALHRALKGDFNSSYANVSLLWQASWVRRQDEKMVGLTRWKDDEHMFHHDQLEKNGCLLIMSSILAALDPEHFFVFSDEILVCIPSLGGKFSLDTYVRACEMIRSKVVAALWSHLCLRMSRWKIRPTIQMTSPLAFVSSPLAPPRSIRQRNAREEEEEEEGRSVGRQVVEEPSLSDDSETASWYEGSQDSLLLFGEHEKEVRWEQEDQEEQQGMAGDTSSTLPDGHAGADDVVILSGSRALLGGDSHHGRDSEEEGESEEGRVKEESEEERWKRGKEEVRPRTQVTTSAATPRPSNRQNLHPSSAMRDRQPVSRPSSTLRPQAPPRRESIAPSSFLRAPPSAMGTSQERRQGAGVEQRRLRDCARRFDQWMSLREQLPVQVLVLSHVCCVGVSDQAWRIFLQVVRNVQSLWCLQLRGVAFTDKQLVFLARLLPRTRISHMNLDCDETTRQTFLGIIQANLRKHCLWRLSEDSTQNHVVNQVKDCWFNPLDHPDNQAWLQIPSSPVLLRARLASSRSMWS
ncbi:hypothetical protein GUITHDRAFT_131537 [Guillardia theta CCMP2712]|uniref:Uncharacterized protein n=1 Tax=Guillardia theta (strain CCMP2712) TaxID=905079 RepID=L1K3Z8_GUITC|nr:hypothetical protein GUITHDRAFT_131537 [Guillardia theta CCMP2712]EKX55304.1 hypothetical protein GUITHDRAFT_131537 [Guillardia theta CCMP2712]|eukprot:XP_005842284.1 hypothetical protein GUITHDRAFT_131537 [Guillardia theta CCMP2712]